MKIKILVLLTFIFTSIHAIAQDEPDDNSKYFDESRSFSEGKNLFKINLSTIINGDIVFYWEKVLGNSFTIETGAGILLPYYTFELADAMFNSDVVSEQFNIDEPGSGFSLWLQPKIYPKKIAPEANYWGLQYRLRNYYLDNKNVQYHDIALNYGVQMIFKNNFILDYTFGIGARVKKTNKNNISNITGGLITPIQLKLSYNF